ncbi:MAG: tRNA lysidine(34) synthetase TilS [Bdellovibrionales bacterium]|nr:tRNA lysidine(34) synthetase TilS [Bdellovibrionales bacterium]
MSKGRKIGEKRPFRSDREGRALRSKWVNLDHQLLRLLRSIEKESLPFSQMSLLIAVSGGLDSMVLLELLYRLRRILKSELAVAHVYHGGSPSEEEGQIRLKFYERVRERVCEMDIPLYSNLNSKDLDLDSDPDPGELKSEEEMRDFRYKCLTQWQKEFSSQSRKPVYLVLAHHADDLLETRLIRLIRGTGQKGLRSMRPLWKDRLRPLLGFQRSDLEAYAYQQRIKWTEDPSNKNEDYLRNWLRGSWLPALESRHQGGVRNLSRSLQRILDQKLGEEFELEKNKEANAGREEETREANEFSSGASFCRDSFNQMPIEKKRTFIASYLRRQGVRAYGQSHIDEIIKRLDTPRKELTFF